MIMADETSLNLVLGVVDVLTEDELDEAALGVELGGIQGLELRRARLLGRAWALINAERRRLLEEPAAVVRRGVRGRRVDYSGLDRAGLLERVVRRLARFRGEVAVANRELTAMD